MISPKDMEQLQRGRTYYPVMETLHQTHVMTEVAMKLVSGQHTKRNKGYAALQLLPPNVDFYPFLRVEFQDGTHKAPTQDRGVCRTSLASAVIETVILS